VLPFEIQAKFIKRPWYQYTSRAYCALRCRGWTWGVVAHNLKDFYPRSAVVPRYISVHISASPMSIIVCGHQISRNRIWFCNQSVAIILNASLVLRYRTGEAPPMSIHRFRSNRDHVSAGQTSGVKNNRKNTLYHLNSYFEVRLPCKCDTCMRIQSREWWITVLE